MRKTILTIMVGLYLLSGISRADARPAGCPSAWCGCWLSMHVFGTNRRDLWKASSWLKFPRTSPRVGAVAVVRRSHVGIVVGFDSKQNPILKSGNYAGGVGTGSFDKRTIVAYVSPR